uniref:RNase H type-1 domain-containing protein n=1 Tax=Manihot esculenta TaxID=3983 RepID=A0A2C9VP16_MANES
MPREQGSNSQPAGVAITANPECKGPGPFHPFVSRKSPPLHSIKWNANDLSLGKPGTSGIGGVLRNSQELKAIAKALEISKDLSITSSCESIFIELDSNIVLSWVADLNSVLWRTSSIINSIVNIPCLTLSSFTHLEKSTPTYGQTEEREEGKSSRIERGLVPQRLS